MMLSNVLTTEQIQTSQEWIRDFYKALDSFDIECWLFGLCTPDIIINFGNAPSMRGYEENRRYFEQQKLLLSSMKHNLTHIDVFPDRIYVENEGTFIVKNDSERKEIKIRAVAVYWKKIDEDKVSLIDIYSDPTPLVERIQMSY